ncbi:MAG: alpha/beta fold hydrolase [Dehalococcoidia bacterium]
MPEFTRDGFTTYYEEAGDAEAPAVVLLHGFTSDNRMWLPVAEQLAQEYRVVAPDMRGHGVTSAPTEIEDYTIEAYADDLKALLDHLEIDICALAGCSFGGMVALQFAVTWPERLAALVLSDTSAAFEHPEYDQAYHDREARIGRQMEIVEAFGTAELGKRAAKDITDPFLAEGIRKRFSRLSREGYLGAASVRRSRGNLLPQLRDRLTMPVLVCIGEDDPVRSASDVMMRELPEARYVTFRGTGHGIPSLRPDEYSRQVMQFFDDLEDSKGVAGKRTVG